MQEWGEKWRGGKELMEEREMKKKGQVVGLTTIRAVKAVMVMVVAVVVQGRFWRSPGLLQFPEFPDCCFP